jgi:hypothetical protein
MANVEKINEGRPQKFSSYIDAKVNHAAATAGKKVWDAMMKVAATGFGKGVLLMGAILIGGFAIGGGLAAAAGGIGVLSSIGLLLTGTTAAAAAAAAAPAATVGQGVMIGLGLAFKVIGAKVGLVALGLGGVVGAGLDMQAARNKITAEQARAEEERLEQSRQQQPQLQPSISTDRSTDLQRDMAAAAQLEHAARELRRRSEAQNLTQVIQ